MRIIWTLLGGHGDAKRKSCRGTAARRDGGRAGGRSSQSRTVRNSARGSSSCTSASSTQETWLGVGLWDLPHPPGQEWCWGAGFSPCAQEQIGSVVTSTEWAGSLRASQTPKQTPGKQKNEAWYFCCILSQPLCVFTLGILWTWWCLSG